MRALVFALFFSVSLLHAGESVTRTFYVTGVECGSCVYAVQQSVGETKGVSDVAVVQVIDSFANVTFDPQVVSEHQIAQAVREAYPLHGMPYLATLKLRLPEYAKHSAKADAVLGRWKDWITVKPVDQAKGEFEIHFLPLKADEKKAGPQGWSLAEFSAALKTGLGLAFTLESEAL